MPNEKAKYINLQLKIEIDYNISDQLHLFLGITDILPRNFVLKMREWNVLDVGRTKADEGKGPRVAQLIESLREICISFSVWASGKAGKDLDFTSLMGPSERKILRQLPELMNFYAKRAAPKKWLWQEFAIFFNFCLCKEIHS